MWIRLTPQVLEWSGRHSLGAARAAANGVDVFNLLYILTAIVLEICGDAAVRLSLRSSKPWLFGLGAVLLIAYGTTISFPKWTFSRTMGVYIAIFFIVSQFVAWLILHEQIRLPAVVGGLLIVAGGLVILVWNPA